jgi:hypothetical protein
MRVGLAVWKGEGICVAARMRGRHLLCMRKERRRLVDRILRDLPEVSLNINNY